MSDVVLRDYQQKIANEAEAFIAAGESCLVVMSTGTGKTATVADVVRRFPGRVLWIAHRQELVSQAAYALSRACGSYVGHETSDPKMVSANERVVVGSKDTVLRRLDRLANAGFRLLAIDESHHSSATSYRTIIDALNIPVIGMTATPRRSDGASLQITRHTTPLGIVDAIDAGWLVPILLRRAKVKSVDLRSVGTVAGDFAVNELDAVMRSEESIHGVVQACIEGAGTRPTIKYCTSVAAADRYAEVFRRYGATAAVVVGTTEIGERRAVIRGFGRDYQYLVNVLVATEGIDLPAAACISIARPTKSVTLLTQVLGRGLRPLPGIDAYTTPEARRDAIALGSKPDCLVLDFVGATGRHRLATAVDLVADCLQVSSSVRTAVSRRVDSDATIDVYAALRGEQAAEQGRNDARAKAKENREKARQALLASVEFELHDASFGDGITAGLEMSADYPPTLRQIEQMREYHIAIPRGVTSQQAKDLIAAVERVRDAPSEAQMRMLKSMGVTRTVGRKEASRLIGCYIASKGRYGRH